MYDFAADGSKISDLAKQIETVAGEISTLSGQIQQGITALNDAWTGSSYDTFSAKCAEYYPAMDTLAKILEAYVSILSENVSPAEEELCNAIKAALSL